MHRVRYLIGLLTLVAAVVAAVWMVRLLRRLDDRPGLALQVEFRDARGLRAGADVRYRGVTVGTVRAVSISGDGNKAVAQVLLEPAGAAHACVNSSFWVVTPRFAGIADGATGLDTLVRDSYVAFRTPAERGSPLVQGSLLAGRERPPANAEPESLEDVEHGDLLMTLLVPENHGLRPGSAVIFRGIETGDVRSVRLAPAGTHVEVELRIARRHRQTVTDKTTFWVARPYVTGALFSGFTVTDVSALLTPYVSYYGPPGAGVLVQDGYRASAEPARPNFEVPPVPPDALRQPEASRPAVVDDVVVARITYAAVERDTFSADDPILRHGSGVLYLDRAGRSLVVTARSLVDGSFTEHDLFGGAPEIDDQQLKVQLGDGSVLRAGRIWVHPGGLDIAVLVLEDAPPDLAGTATARLAFGGEVPAGSELELRAAGADGMALPGQPLAADAAVVEATHGAAVVAAGRVIGVCGKRPDGAGAVVALEQLPEDLRPR